MRPALLWAMLRHELSMQWRTARFRLGLLLYLAMAVAPPIVLAVRSDREWVTLRTVSYLGVAFQVLPFATIVLSLLVVGNTAHQAGRAQLLTSAPVSNAGFVLRKWLVQSALVVSLTLIAVAAVLAVAVIADPSRIPLQQAFGKWLVLLLPRALISCAGWLGAVLLLRSEVASLFATTLLPKILTTAVNQLTFRHGVVLDEFSWLEFRTFTSWGQDLFRSLSYDDARYLLTPTSDADFPIATAFTHLSTRLILPAATALVFLAVAIAHLSRCHADVPASRLGRQHPLRNLGRRLQKLREELRSDAGLTRHDRLLRLSLVVGAVCLLGWAQWRAYSWNAVARERYLVEAGNPFPTTPRQIIPEDHRITGSLSADGRVRFETRIELSNQGTTPVDVLAFELAPELELPRFEATGRELSLVRRWDRLQVTVAPPIESGGRVALLIETAGRPVERTFRLRKMSDESFATAFDRHRQPHFPRDVSAILHSHTTPLVGARRTLLPASAVFPRLRFASWQLTPESNSVGGRGKEVPAEDHHPMIDFQIEAGLPEGWVVADGCGQNSAGNAHLSSRCVMSLDSFTLAGGQRRVVRSADSAVTVATLAGHESLGGTVFEALDRVANQADRLVDRSDTTRHSVITALEMPDARDLLDQRFWQPGDNRQEATTVGRLILLPESRLLFPEPLAAEQLVSSVLLHDLSPRFVMPPNDQRAFLALHRALLLARTGTGTPSAMIAVPNWARYRIYGSLLQSGTHDSAVWQIKVPAILRDLEHKVGRTLLFETFQSFLASGHDATTGALPTDRTVTLADIFAAVGERANVDLDTFYDEYVNGTALPSLSLIDTETSRLRDGYRVSGSLNNSASGHATCDISVKTARGEVLETVTVPPRSSTRFEIVTTQRPFTLILDPYQTCFRVRASFAPDSVPLITT